MTTTEIRPDAPLETAAETTGAGHQVEVRRHTAVAAVLGAASSLLAIGYLARSVGGGGAVDVALTLVLGLIGVVNLLALLDARTPLLVADVHGVRIRLGRAWAGLPWEALDRVEHTPRRGLLRDGSLVLRARYAHRVVEDLDSSARRAVRWSSRLHGAPLAVPLGLATRVVGDQGDLTATLETLAAGDTEVVEVMPPAVAVVDEATDHELADDAADLEVVPLEDAPLEDVEDDEDDDLPAARRLPDPRPVIAHAISVVAARWQRVRVDEDPADSLDEVETDTDADDAETVASETPEPGREPAVAARAEVALEEDTQVWSERFEPVEPSVTGPRVLIDDLAPVTVEPAPEPVIGPQFAAARRRLGLTVDQVAERTRIRPHVIESIEVDDFAACGGDFYARGHLRTLARVLGLDAAPLLTAYDETYAGGPIDARRVFEAELAGAGSIRTTSGGPNWSILVAAVMALVLAWSVARLVMDGPVGHHDRAVLSGSGGPNHSGIPQAPAVPVQVSSPAGGARVIVRNGVGDVVFAGNLAFGQTKSFKVSPPVRVQSTDGAVRVKVDGQDHGPIGRAGRTASDTYVVRR